MQANLSSSKTAMWRKTHRRNALTNRLQARQSVGSDEGVPLAVAKRVFGHGPKAIIEELNEVLVA